MEQFTNLTYYPINNYNANSSNASIDAPICGGSVIKDIWLEFQAPMTGNLNINTIAGTITDAAMEIFTKNGSCNNITSIACNDDFNYPTDRMPIILIPVTAGQNYFIRLWEYDGDFEGEFEINLTYQ